MAAVNVRVNGRDYAVGCEDGQEAHVEALARQFDTQVQEVGAAVGAVGEVRLFLMAALLGADELADARVRLASAQAELARLQSASALAEARAARALDAAAGRVDSLLAD